MRLLSLSVVSFYLALTAATHLVLVRMTPAALTHAPAVVAQR